MSPIFKKIRFNAIDKSQKELRSIGTTDVRFRGIGVAYTGKKKEFHNDESAARYYLNKILEQDERASVRSFSRSVAPAREAELVPDMKLKKIQDGILNTKIVHFTQTKRRIPIFGTHLTVELDQNREFLNLTGKLAEVDDVSTITSLS